MRMLSLSPHKYPEECALYKKHEDEIIKYCSTYIQGNWMLSFVLWGETEETAKPTILLVYEGTKADDWTDPAIEGLAFVAQEEIFWGAMAAKKPVVETQKPEPVVATQEPVVRKKERKWYSCRIC